MGVKGLKHTVILEEPLASRRCGKCILVLVVATVAAQYPHRPSPTAVSLLAASSLRQRLILTGLFESILKVSFLAGTARKGFIFQETSFPWIVAAVAMDSSGDLWISVSGGPNTCGPEPGCLRSA